MESFKLHSKSSLNIISSCCQNGVTIIYDGASLIYFETSQKVLPWFKDPEMVPIQLTLLSSILAILTKDGTILIIPVSSLSEPNLLPEWRKFIDKNYFLLVNKNRQDSLIDMLGGCMVNRDRPFENYLDISIFKLKISEFLGIVWFNDYIVISLTTTLWVIDPVTSVLENKLNIKSKILKTEVAGNFLLNFTEDGVFLMNYSEILNEKYEFVKTLWKGTVNVFPDHEQVGVCYGQKMDLYCLDQVLKPIITFWVPEGYARYILWNKFILCIDPGVVVIAKVPATKPKMLPLVEEAEKFCICGTCTQKEVGMNYSEWIYRTQETCVIWKTWENIGNVSTVLHENYIEILSNAGIFQLQEISFDVTPNLIEAVDNEDINRVHQLIHIAESREKDLNSYLNELAKCGPKLRALRLFIFSNNPPLAIAELYFSEESLHIELYNYLWASYFSIPNNLLPHFAECISSLLVFILKFNPSHKKGPILAFQPTNHKSLFGRLDIEPGLCYLLPLLVPVDQNLPINKLMLYLVKEHFSILRPSIQLTLLILAEQLPIELPVHKILTICEQLQYCKILRILLRLTNSNTLFKKSCPIFEVDKFLSLLPLPINKSFSIRTTKIVKKSKNSKKVAIKKISEKIEKFFESFEIYKENYNTMFNQTLTKYIILFSYAVHKEQSEEILNIFVMLLRKFEGFYDLHQIFLSATALRSCIVLAGIYEFQGKWVCVFKARLLMNRIEPLELLKSYLEKGEEEDKKALMIYSCYLYCQKNGIGRNCFLEKALPNKHENLIKYVLSHTPEY